MPAAKPKPKPRRGLDEVARMGEEMLELRAKPMAHWDCACTTNYPAVFALWTRALRRLFHLLVLVAGDNNVCPKIKIVDQFISPFSWQIASTLWIAMKNERLMLERLPEQTWSAVARKS